MNDNQQSDAKPLTPQEWAQFHNSLEIRFQEAVLREEGFFDGLHEEPPAEATFTLHQLAACSSGAPTVPTGERIIDPTDSLAMLVEPEDGVLKVTLRTRGYDALDRLSSRWVRVISDDRTVEADVEFGRDGAAELLLADTEEVRRALTRISVDLRPLTVRVPTDQPS